MFAQLGRFQSATLLTETECFVGDSIPNTPISRLGIFAWASSGFGVGLGRSVVAMMTAIGCCGSAGALFAQAEHQSSAFVIPIPAAHQIQVADYQVASRPVHVVESSAVRTVSLPGNATLTGEIDLPVATSILVQPSKVSPVSANSVADDWNLEATDWRNRQLQSKLATAAEGLEQSRLPQLEEAKDALKSALVQVESYVGVGTENGQRWLKFLRVDEIRAELENQRLQPAKFAELEMNMRQNYLGLENAPMIQLRSALHDMKLAAKYGQTPPDRTIQSLQSALQQVAESLNGSESNGAGSQRSEAVGRVLNLLVETNQVPNSVAEVRSVFSTSNFQVTVRENGINRLISRAVAEPSPVNECILGTRVIGRACLTGNISADLFPVQSGLGVRVNLSGQLTSRNRGYNRGVVLGTSSTSPVFLSKPVVVNQQGVTSSPSSISTRLQTSINSIQHRLKIVRRIAKRKAAEQKSQADAISEWRMQKKVKRQYEEQVEEQLAQARGKLAEVKEQTQNRPEFQRVGFPKPQVSFASSDTTVDLNAVQAASYQLAADTSSPIPKPLDALAVIDLHQSAIINALETLLADRTIHQHDLDDLAKQILGKVPEELLNGEPQDPFTVTMLGYNPVQVEFDQDQVKISLRFSRIDGNDRKIPGAIVTVQYAVTMDDNRFVLSRQGDLEIELPRVRSRIQATSLRSAVKVKLEPVFKETIVSEPVDIRKLFPNAPPISLASVRFDDGWLQVVVR
ncbi:MAG: hypothetical protein ACE361_17070 [Aureliella sp.]